MNTNPRPVWVVLCTDERQGESFVVGPFDTQVDANKWASVDASEKADSWGMHSGLDADGEGWLSILDANDDCVYVWNTTTMVRP